MMLCGSLMWRDKTRIEDTLFYFNLLHPFIVAPQGRMQS